MKRYTVDDIPDGSDALAGAFVAREYYGGQWTALYALTSTGSLELYPGDGLGPIIRELKEAVQIAQANWDYGTGDESEALSDLQHLKAFLAWCEKTHAADSQN